MIKILFWIIFIILEIPFFIKFLQAKEEYNITRMTAILIIMFFTALICLGLYKSVLFMVK